MAQNIRKNRFLHKFGKNFQEFAEFIVSPWFHRTSVKSLQKRVEYLERRVYQGLPTIEKRLESVIEHLQHQLNFLQNNTKNQIDSFVEYDLRQQVLEVLKEQTHVIVQTIKPTVEDLIHELEDKKYSEDKLSPASIQARQNKLLESLVEIQQLATLLPNLEAQTAASLEAGRWLLANREELAQDVAQELLSSQHPQVDVFRYNLNRYLKLLGSCLENGIEPRLLYQGMIAHQQPPVEKYLEACQLIKDRYIQDWEHSAQISTKAAEELRKYFSYLSDYLVQLR
ncbi:MAG: hypothetical protein SAK29_35880 [Scytonema sp. PMC 1069.18]|nr:hypothetical protein [Scytonema sp. PMC 1069.18]MEC4880491.1 hypothetical protein [Scytonema sp. PMC 1070.18]